MNNWFADGRGNFYKSSDFHHLWIDRGADYFFILGEWKHNAEEIVVSDAFNTYEEAEKWIMNVLDQGSIQRIEELP